MLDILTQENLVDFIQKYGDGDIYFSHYRETNGTIIIKYLPAFTKFADEDNIDTFKKELTDNPHLKERYLQEIILTPKFAYIPNSDKNNKNKLVKNYGKFLEDVKTANSKKFAVKSKYCKPENNKNYKKHNQR